MLNWLKDLFQPILVTDPVLGPVRYLRDTRTWEGWIDFSPVGYRVEVLLGGGPSQVPEPHRSFLQDLARRYSSIEPQLVAMLTECAAAEGSHVPLHFQLVAIDLPEASEHLTWELCFETNPPSSFFVVAMDQFSPVGVSVEC